MNKQIIIDELGVKVKHQFSLVSESIKEEITDRLSLGASVIFLNSILEHLDSLEIILPKGYIESAGAIATSLWERSITLQFLLTNPDELIRNHMSHSKVRKTPWSVKQMVNGIIDSESLLNHVDPKNEKDLLYLQYTYFCAIKHGNPYTISYLNRIESKAPKTPIVGANSNHTDVDNDLKNWIYLVSITTALDALLKFSQRYFTKEKSYELNRLNNSINAQIINDIKLTVPQIILTSSAEFRPEFWEYLVNLENK